MQIAIFIIGQKNLCQKQFMQIFFTAKKVAISHSAMPYLHSTKSLVYSLCALASTLPPQLGSFVCS